MDSTGTCITEGPSSRSIEIPTLVPGESRPDVCLDISGKLIFCCQLSPSMALFTLHLDPASRALFDATDNATRIDTSGDPPDLIPDASTRENGTSTASTTGMSGMTVLDVLMHRKEGWGKELLEETYQSIRSIWDQEIASCTTNGDHNHTIRQSTTTIHVNGFLARLYPKHPTDSDPLVMHARTIRIQDQSLIFAAEEMIIQPKIVTVTPEDQTAHDMTVDRKKDRLFSGQKDNSRFGKFVGFLLKEFGGYPALSQQPVLDVAGGAGALAFELSIRHEIPTVVVDTQLVRFKAFQQRHLDFRKYCLVQLATDLLRVSPMAHNLTNRMRINEFEQIQCFLESEHVLEANELAAIGGNRKSILPKVVSQEEDSCKLNPEQAKLCTLLRNRKCSVLLGLHPDQATDPIIDIGLALGIPWAIVPCCVFPNLFQTRQLASSGKPVRSYEDICTYILERDPSIQQATLPFRGRNQVFYWHPPVANKEKAAAGKTDT
ncbi:expressed unknown protein [Seminavis robusta]|uniref:Uncharacterized protein n=1 Tax=Seminavis robusta TaxID=568900 RepID=A0A9N8EXJ6_9STRA|nr:expressed unknown protein [Seminavis robusta]|eukprot:Sro2396_g326000.1 n/a (490) ;mRNA; f:7161-8630